MPDNGQEQVEVVAAAIGSGVAANRVLIAPWGLVQSSNGDFVLDAEAGRMVVEAFAAHGTDVPVDYEHQSLGGTYASPSGQAPAAGWIKSLRAVAPNEDAEGAGLLAEVEWTAAAREKLDGREYRYLSPVVIVRKRDRRMVALHSAALTNKPAIVGMRPIVNREMSERSGAAERVQVSECESGKGSDAMQAGADGVISTQEDRPAGSRSHTREELAAASEELAASEALLKDEKQLKGETLLKDEALSGGVEVLRLRLGLEVGSDSETVMLTAERRLADLMAEASRREAEGRVAAATRAGKLIPVQQEWAMTLALRDPSAFDEWAATAPVVVGLGRTEPPAKGLGGGTSAIIASARAAYRAEPSLALLTSEEAWVAQVMREGRSDA